MFMKENPDRKKNLETFFRECNSIETPFNDADHSVSLDLKCYNTKNNFNFSKLTINKNSLLVTVHLGITSLSKHFDDNNLLV